MYFQDTLLPTRASSDQTRMKRLHVATVFNFPGATRNEKNRIYQKNEAQLSIVTNFRKN